MTYDSDVIPVVNEKYRKDVLRTNKKEKEETPIGKNSFYQKP